MRHTLAALSLALIASPALAQPAALGPTDPVMPAAPYVATSHAEAPAPAATTATAGATRADAPRITHTRERHVEDGRDFYDPSA